MCNRCHYHQPSCNYTDMMENNTQYNQVFDRFLYDPNIFIGNIENCYGPLVSHDWSAYNQLSSSQSIAPSDTLPVYEGYSTDNFLKPYDPSLNMVPQAVSPAFMSSPSSVDSDNLYDPLPLTPEFEPESLPAPPLFPTTNYYPMDNCLLSTYDESICHKVKIESQHEEQALLENASAKKKGSRRRTTAQQLKCPVCEREFTRPYNLKSHLRIHTNLRPYICEFEGCKWTFARPHDLKRHQMLHTGIKPFECDCGKSFARSDAYKRHQKVDAVCIARRAELVELAVMNELAELAAANVLL